MPLIDLKTNLKSLSYNGNGPYIQKDISNPGPPATGFVQARIDDTSRILRLLGEKGVAFTSKQALLLAGTKGFGAIPQAAGILANIVAQVPVNGTGTHFLPIGRNVYYTGVDNASSRALAGNQIGAPSGRPFGFDRPSRIVDRSSAYRRTSFISDLNQEINSDLNQEINYTPGGEFVKPTDAILAVQSGNSITINTFKGKGSLDTQYGFAETKKSDSINLLGIGQDIDAKNNIDDLVPIKFAVLTNALTSVNTLVFRGFLGDLSDRFSGQWNSTRYVGRGENFYTYDNFNRMISFNFQIPIFSIEEQKPVYDKVNSLASITAPTYVNNLAQGKIVDLQVGSYLKTKGILTEVGITINNDVPWSNGSGDNSNILLPQVLSVAISFIPIHSKTPQYYANRNSPNPFIAPGYKKVLTPDSQTQAVIPANLA